MGLDQEDYGIDCQFLEKQDPKGNLLWCVLSVWKYGGDFTAIARAENRLESEVRDRFEALQDSEVIKNYALWIHVLGKIRQRGIISRVYYEWRLRSCWWVLGISL